MCLWRKYVLSELKGLRQTTDRPCAEEKLVAAEHLPVDLEADVVEALVVPHAVDVFRQRLEGQCFLVIKPNLLRTTFVDQSIANFQSHLGSTNKIVL